MTTKEVTRPVSAAPVKTAAPPALAASVRRLSPVDFLQNEITRVFDSFNGFGVWPAAFADQTFSPKLEVTESDDGIEVTAELPGMDHTDIDISVADGLLTVRGEKKFEKDEKKKNYRVVERSYGAFERCVGLPQGVDASKVKAKMSNGVLKIEIPKPADSRAHQVKIRTE